MTGTVCLYASAIHGMVLRDRDGTAVGRLRDLVAICAPSTLADVVSVVVRHRRRDYRIDISAIDEFGAKGGVVSREGMIQTPFERRDGEVLLFSDVLDAEVIDRQQQRVVRVNDVVLAWNHHRLYCRAIDASASGLGRRLAPRWLADRFTGPTIAWDHVELMIDPPPGIDFRLSHAALHELHPADIAKLIDHLPYRQGARMLCALQTGLAADTLEEVEKRRQPEIVEYLPRDRAIAILNAMAPDAAADLLEAVPRAQSDTLIASLEPKASADIRLLLSYPHHSAAGLMTTDFVMALKHETAEQALTYVRAQLRKPDLVYYIYIVDNANDRRLQGVISLRDLLLATPTQVLEDCMSTTTRLVHPEEHAKEVARIMGEYNLLALPVVDDHGRMLGLVTADDVLDLLLPESLRQHLPRLFS